jgi:hypothetical protein
VVAIVSLLELGLHLWVGAQLGGVSCWSLCFPFAVVGGLVAINSLLA